jgi:hypothetical protein
MTEDIKVAVSPFYTGKDWTCDKTGITFRRSVNGLNTYVVNPKSDLTNIRKAIRINSLILMQGELPEDEPVKAKELKKEETKKEETKAESKEVDKKVEPEETVEKAETKEKEEVKPKAKPKPKTTKSKQTTTKSNDNK